MEQYVVMAGAALAALLGLAAVVRKPGTFASWCFLAGLLVLGSAGILAQSALEAGSPAEIRTRLSASLVALAFLPGPWLAFSLSYARGNAAEFLRRFRWLLGAATVVPVGFALAFREDLLHLASAEGGLVLSFGSAARWLGGMVLLASVLVLVNLERTLRAAVGTVRWRVKYVFIGASVIFGTRIFTLSQILLFSGLNPAMSSIESGALVLGVLLMAVAYLRHGFGDLDIYPSRTVLHGSLTFVLAAGYLIVVGVLAQVVAALGGVQSFTAQAFVLLLGMVGLTVLLLSDRFRARMHQFVTRHFHRPRYDVRALWNSFTEETSGAVDRFALSKASAELVSRTFEILTVRIFLVDGPTRKLVQAASTSEGGPPIELAGLSARAEEAFRGMEGVLNLDAPEADWAEPLREACAVQFKVEQGRYVLPLMARELIIGLMLLGDRVAGRPFSKEEEELLKCVADQLGAALLNQSLTEEAAEARELQAFQTMSTFFVHDLKNAANSLGLMLQNLPEHFDDPEFREDALRAIGKAVERINKMIAKLSAIREHLSIERIPADLKAIIERAVSALIGTLGGIDLVKELGPVPELSLDPEQIESVVTNFLANAAEAVEPGGRVGIATEVRADEVVLEIRDNGSGMSPEFVRDSLFRPFQSTKSKGLGVGMFQSKLIVEAHQGSIEVESEPGRGTTFRILLPLPGPVAAGEESSKLKAS